MTITKPLGIINDGAGTADILQGAPGKNAITINAGGGSVHLRGLSLDGAGNGAAGVRLNSASSVTIIKCVARRFANYGFLLAASDETSFLISNTIASDNGTGIYVSPSASSAKGVIDQGMANNNVSYGVAARGKVAMTVVDSVASKNGNGIAAVIGASMTVRDTTSINNSNSGYYVINPAH